MKVNRSIRSPNFDSTVIPCEFVVLHYSACGLQATFEIFRDPAKKVSSHLVISTSGEIYEVVNCLDGEMHRAWHAGKSSWNDGEKTWEGFNDFSLGIELINNNGNLVEYHEKQYEALFTVLRHLRTHYPSAIDPNRIVGHEHIAGKRGKVDPGWNFDWFYLFSECYPDFVPPERTPVLPMALKDSFEKFLPAVPSDERSRSLFWQALSLSMETSVRLIHDSKET